MVQSLFFLPKNKVKLINDVETSYTMDINKKDEGF